MSSIIYIGKQPGSILDKVNECWKPKEILFSALLVFALAILPEVLYIIAFKLAGLQ